MELSERKQKILSLVVEQFIITGEPVGSKLLCGALDCAVSSATIRNEMAELATLGYLEQPHTSAGRIPSQKGYRYYIDHLMRSYELPESDRGHIRMELEQASGEPESVLGQASEILARMTGCTAVSSAPLAERTVIRRVELVPVTTKTAMVVLLTSSGMLKSHVCRCDAEITLEMVELFYNIAGVHFTGKRPSDINIAQVQTIAASLEDKSLVMLPLLVTLAQLAAAASKSEIYLDGQSNLFNYRELEANAAQLMDFLHRGEPLSQLLLSNREELSVLIGKENAYREMENSSFIMSKYRVAGEDSGSLAIIGPTRLDYPRLISGIKYLSFLVSELLSAAIEE